MRKILVSIFIVVTAFAQQPQELRGVWITNVDSDMLSSDAKIAQGMNFLSSIGINVVFPVVWNSGYTLYPSTVMKNLIGIEIYPHASYANRDPLKRLIIEAHRNGIEVIPWFEYGLATKYVTSASEPGEILSAKPHWASKNKDGKLTTNVTGGGLPSFVWMNGINPDVQDFMLSLVTEVVDRYDVDGIQGDDRLPALPYEGGYDSVTSAIYTSEHFGTPPPANHADAEWVRWRANRLNGLMKRIYDSVKVRGKNLIVSSGPSEYAWGFPSLLQDSKSWVDSGMIDNFIPQLYPDAGDRTTPQGATSAYIFRLDRALGYVPQAKRSIFFGGVLSKVGTYVADYSTLVGNVQANRARGIKGETYFFYEGIANANRKNGDSLRATVYKSDALLPYRNGNVWRPKGLVVNEDDGSAKTSGVWVKNVSPGFQGGILVARDTGYAKIEYTFTVPVTAWYDVYAYIGGSPSIYTQRAPYLLHTGVDTSTVYFDQSKAAASTWQKLTTAHMTKGTRTVVTLENTNIEPNRLLMADGIMLMINRRLSPEAVVTSAGKKKERSEHPLEFALDQNYPNPFNPLTTIRFSMSAPGNVVLEIYDLLGRTVETLVSERKESGQHRIQWDASHISTGIYFYRLQVEGKSVMKKMALLK